MHLFIVFTYSTYLICCCLLLISLGIHNFRMMIIFNGVCRDSMKRLLNQLRIKIQLCFSFLIFFAEVLDFCLDCTQLMLNFNLGISSGDTSQDQQHVDAVVFSVGITPKLPRGERYAYQYIASFIVAFWINS